MSKINIVDISKSFGKKQVLNNISISIEKGKIYGLLGNNGQGKSTLLNIITNKIFATSGNVKIDDVSLFENDAELEKIFLMSETSFKYETSKVKDFIKCMNLFYKDFDMQKAFNLCDEFGVNLKDKMSKLSTGYKSIVKAIVAISSGAEFIMFDEPILGLDIVHRDMLYKQIIKVYEETGCGIVISTHIIEEIQNMLEHVIIINKKRVIVDEDVNQLLEQFYLVSGADNQMHEYIAGKDVISMDKLSGFSNAIIKGKPQKNDNLLEFKNVELYQLFIAMTKGGSK